jgi:ribonuclease Z
VSRCRLPPSLHEDEVAAAPPELLAANPYIQNVIAHHTSPAQAGRVFARASPKMAATRQTYAGPLTLGEDLMSFDIGNGVTVRRFEQ